MIATALTPVTAWYLGLDFVLVAGVVVLILLLLFAHRDNVMAQRSSSPPIEPRTP
jgi:hypothetical protein